MGIPVKLQVFEEWTFCFTLIEKTKVNIYDIPIVELQTSTWNTFMPWNGKT